MAFWRASVNAAEVRKAVVASVEAVLKPIPPFLTGSDVCSHWVSSKSTCKINEQRESFSQDGIESSHKWMVLTITGSQCMQQTRHT